MDLRFADETREEEIMMVVIDGHEYVRKLPEKAIYNTLGELVRTRRKSLGLTLDSAASRIGCSKSYLWEIEKDKSSLSLLLAACIAKELDIPIQSMATAALRGPSHG